MVSANVLEYVQLVCIFTYFVGEVAFVGGALCCGR